VEARARHDRPDRNIGDLRLRSGHRDGLQARESEDGAAFPIDGERLVLAGVAPEHAGPEVPRRADPLARAVERQAPHTKSDPVRALLR
jgi:hypothetical protein